LATYVSQVYMVGPNGKAQNRDEMRFHRRHIITRISVILFLN
jgi:hypothetical protein